MPNLTMGGKRKRLRKVPATMPEVSLYFKCLGIMTLGADQKKWHRSPYL